MNGDDVLAIRGGGVEEYASGVMVVPMIPRSMFDTFSAVHCHCMVAGVNGCDGCGCCSITKLLFIEWKIAVSGDEG